MKIRVTLTAPTLPAIDLTESNWNDLLGGSSLPRTTARQQLEASLIIKALRGKQGKLVKNLRKMAQEAQKSDGVVSYQLLNV